MKRVLLISVLVIAGGAILLELIRRDTGYVMIALGGTTIEMSFWMAVALLLGAWLAIWFIGWLLKGVRRTVTGGMGMAARRSRKVEKSTASGLIYFVESNWRAAKKDLLKAAKHAQHPLVHYLAAARCAYELGEHEETRQLLHKAERIAPQNELAVMLSQARIQLLDQKYEQCLATLNRAHALAPHHPTVLDLLRQVHWQLRDWQSLQALLPELRRQKLYREDEQALLEQNVCMAQLSAAGKQAERDLGSAEKHLHSAWQSLPKQARDQEPVIALYARLLSSVSLNQPAEALLRKRLGSRWSAELVALYGTVAAPQPKDQLATAESWLREHPTDPDLLLALGRIGLRNELWGKARGYFEKSLQSRPQPETYAELARLLAYLGEHQKSTELYQKGLLATTQGLPSLPMPEPRLNIDPDETEQERAVTAARFGGR